MFCTLRVNVGRTDRGLKKQNADFALTAHQAPEVTLSNLFSTVHLSGRFHSARGFCSLVFDSKENRGFGGTIGAFFFFFSTMYSILYGVLVKENRGRGE